MWECLYTALAYIFIIQHFPTGIKYFLNFPQGLHHVFFFPIRFTIFVEIDMYDTTQQEQYFDIHIFIFKEKQFLFF